MKKYLAIALVLILCTSLLVVPVAAAGSGSMSVTSATAHPGDTVSLTVSIDTNPGVMGMKVAPSYDTAYLTLDSITGTGLSGWTTGNAASWVNSVMEDTVYTGAILVLNFTVKTNAPLGSTNVSVSVNASNYDEELISFSASAGTVTVTEKHVCAPVYVKGTPADCETAGQKEHYKCSCGKLYLDAAGTQEVAAADLVIAKVGHKYEWVVDQEATEDVPGVKHEECSECHAKRNEGTEIPKKPHVHSLTDVQPVAASCTAKGTKGHYKCEKCGKLYSDAEATNEVTAADLETPMLAHEYGWVVDRPATEDVPGVKHEECANCGTKRNEGTEIPKLDHEHVFTKVEAVAPTCTKAGNVEHYICSDEDCEGLYFDADGNVISNVMIPATGKHNYQNGVCVDCGVAQIVAPVLPSDKEKPTFIDVLPGAYYYEAVEWAVANGITNGITATTFCPDMGCTRAQMVTFLWRAAGKPVPATTEMPFKDVAKGAYYYDAVLWAVENGITNGTSATTFSPDATVTRAQTVTFLWRMQKSPDVDGTMKFVDVKQDAYYAEAVLWAVEEGITFGTSATTFSPDADCTRAQIVTFLWRCLVK